MCSLKPFHSVDDYDDFMFRVGAVLLGLPSLRCWALQFSGRNLNGLTTSFSMRRSHLGSSESHLKAQFGWFFCHLWTDMAGYVCVVYVCIILYLYIYVCVCVFAGCIYDICVGVYLQSMSLRKMLLVTPTAIVWWLNCGLRQHL